MLHLHHVLDPCGFTVLYLHQSSGSGRHFGKCIGVDGWLLYVCVCVSVSLPFLLVCVCVCGDFPFMSWTRSTNEQLHQAQKEPQTAAAAAPSPSPSPTAATSASAVLVSSKDQRPGTRGQLFEPSIHPNPQCPIRRRHFLKPACPSRTIYTHPSHRPGPEPVLKPRPAQAASLVCGFVQADDFFILRVKYFQYSRY